MTYSDIQQTVNLESKIIPQVSLSQGTNHSDTAGIYHAIITSLIIAVFQDLQRRTVQRINREDLGWRNKYNIHLLSGVSQKQIYKECGIIEKLIEQRIIEKRPSQSRWGKQKHQYRLSFSQILQTRDIFYLSMRSE
ncbi:MAG: hypothetical protein ACTSSE_14545 [Candidatus Thorarchaeota archaeon]